MEYKTSEKQRQRSTDYYYNNRHEILKRTAKRREGIARERSEYQAEYRRKNPEKVKAMAKAYRIKHPDKVRSVIKAWRAAAPFWLLTAITLRTISKKNAMPCATANELRDLWIKQGERCAITGLVPYGGRPHLDHIVPQSKGGAHTIDNLQWLCPRINRAKGTSTNEEILAWWTSR